MGLDYAVDTPRNPGRLRPGPRFWLLVIATMAGLDGLTFALTPHLVSSGAYAWANNLPGMTATRWGIFMLLTSVVAMFALWDDGRFKVGDIAARVAMVMHGIVGGLFGLSIFVLTLEGSSSAITGATKWWVLFIIPLRFLRYHDLFESTAGGGA